VRWDGGIEPGNEVTLYYDPLLAKLIVWGETREVAIQRMRRALRELVIVGVPTSQVFHLRVLDDAEFRRGEVDISYVERATPRLLTEPVSGPLVVPIAVVAALLAEERRTGPAPVRVATNGDPDAPAPGAIRETTWVRAARQEGLRDG
jgi:acetyl/propionyl-CoA carboxylase alpha subunit